MPLWLEPLLARILLAALQTLGLVGTLNALITKTAQEHIPFQVESTVVATSLNVASPTYGLAALKADIDALAFQLGSDVASLTLQISDLTDGTTPVSLPVVPPAGYAAPSGSDVADSVWEYNRSPLYSQARNYLAAAGNWGAFSANLRWLGDENPYFVAVYGSADFTAGASDWVPVFDPLDILAGETILDCLTRQNPTWTVTNAFVAGGHVRLYFPGSAEIQEWLTTFDAAGFQAIKALLYPVALGDGAPLWPGLANVILGSPTALGMGVTIAGPMDGVLIEITGAPTKQGYFTFDTLRSYRNVGALAFLTDDGEAEFPQTLGFVSAVYAPKAMVQAGSVVIRCSEDVTGTCTPWVAL